jgi:RNA polymerase sigma factor (sigma-70 family)
MMPNEAKLREYEGLIRCTAARYAPILDEHDFDDVQQVLRLKVWRALAAYDPRRSSQTEQGFVFSCVTNQVKDLLKSSSRRNEARGGRQLYIEEERQVGPDGASSTKFDTDYMSVTEDEVYAVVLDERVKLPSTVNQFERRVIALLLLDFNQTEIAAKLCVTRTKVRAAQAEIQVKMADWRPSSAERAVPSLQAAA